MKTDLQKQSQREYMKKRYTKCKELNLCVQCGNPATGKRKKPLCQSCIDKIRFNLSNRVQDRLARGLCQSCGKHKIKAGHNFCEICLEKLRLNSRNSIRRNWKNYMWHGTKTSARKRHIEFTITENDIPDMPIVCPLLQISLEIGTKHVRPNSPTIDRIDSSKGYIPGNIWIISQKANSIKSNATAEEIALLSKNLNRILRKKSGNTN